MPSYLSGLGNLDRMVPGLSRSYLSLDVVVERDKQAWALGACPWPSVTPAVVGLAGDGITSRMDRGIEIQTSIVAKRLAEEVQAKLKF